LSINSDKTASKNTVEINRIDHLRDGVKYFFYLSYLSKFKEFKQ